MKKPKGVVLGGALMFIAILSSVSATPIQRSSAGATPGAIQPQINEFFNDLGGADNGTGSSFTTGRRSLDFGLIPDNFAIPNLFQADFFNTTVPRGALLNTGCNNNGISFSADSSNPTNTPIVFSNLNASYLGQFITYNSQRIMNPGVLARPCTTVFVTFFVPGTDVPATVKGFGIVFTDADLPSGSFVQFYDAAGKLLNPASVQTFNSGLSFVGISYNAGERIASVKITVGTHSISASDAADVDVVAVAGMFYGEPRAMEFHSGDFDGDGSADSAIFRPPTGHWFTLNSGSNTFTAEQWGVNGDIPVDGDFDGDSRADLCIFRPSNGQWWLKRSSDGSTLGATFGQAGDKPVVGDYDKDGKSDMVIWRPANGNYYVLRSSSNFSTFYAYPFGQNGDIPIQGGAQ
jgi:hypothetical protein